MNRLYTCSNNPDVKNIIITGGNSGIGFNTAKKLSLKNCCITLGVRNIKKGAEAKEKILAFNPKAKIDLIKLDLSDLESVRSFAKEYHSRHDKLYLLYNNAGIMWNPYELSKQGYEMHFATNHLGHFMLTGLLIDMIISTPDSKVVTTTSIARLFHTVNNFKNTIHGEDYNRYRAYSNSKMMNYLFSYELSKFFQKCDVKSKSISVHPGISRTRLFLSASGKDKSLIRRFIHAASGMVISQPAAWGALSNIKTYEDAKIKNGEMVSPSVFGIWGIPVRKKLHIGRNLKYISKELWDLSKKLTNCEYKLR